MCLEYRDFRIDDLDMFATVVGRVFKDDTYTTNRHINHYLLRHELLDYLRSQNYAKVVEDGGKPVGILIADIGCLNRRRQYTAEMFHCWLNLAFNRAGRQYLRYRRGLRKTDMRLLLGKHYAAELRLFIVVEQYRNMGIGHQMLTDFQKACVGQGIHQYFLFTDSYCDVEYYVERGFHLEAEREYDFFANDPPAKYYLFTKTI